MFSFDGSDFLLEKRGKPCIRDVDRRVLRGKTWTASRFEQRYFSSVRDCQFPFSPILFDALRRIVNQACR